MTFLEWRTSRRKRWMATHSDQVNEESQKKCAIMATGMHMLELLAYPTKYQKMLEKRVLMLRKTMRRCVGVRRLGRKIKVIIVQMDPNTDNTQVM